MKENAKVNAQKDFFKLLKVEHWLVKNAIKVAKVVLTKLIYV